MLQRLQDADGGAQAEVGFVKHSFVTRNASISSRPWKVLAIISKEGCSLIFIYFRFQNSDFNVSFPRAPLFLGFGLHDTCAGGYVFGHPDIAAHGRSTSHGDASQNGGVGVDDDVVFQNGMAGDTLDGLAVGIEGEALGTQRDALVELDVVSDDAGFADYHTRAVVDGKVVAYLCARMDVDTRLAMCHFGDDAGDEGYAEAQQLVGHAIVADGADGRIAADDFAERVGGGVTVVGGFDVGGQDAPHLGQGGDEACRLLGCLLAELLGAAAVLLPVACKTEFTFEMPK